MIPGRNEVKMIADRRTSQNDSRFGNGSIDELAVDTIIGWHSIEDSCWFRTVGYKLVMKRSQDDW